MDLTVFSPSSALLTVVLLTLAPFAAVMVTSFTKIVVVLSLLRNALGVQQVPPNLVLNGIAMVLTVYIMYPTGLAMLDNVSEIDDFSSSTDNIIEAANLAKEPLREFLIKHSDERERDAFQIGFLIFLPFIVIDLVISNILMAMGMMMLSPTIISLPFKLLLFVLVEGWAKLAHGLVISYL